MSATEMRTQIDAWLDRIQEQDEGLFKAVHAMLGTYVKTQENEKEASDDEVIGYHVDTNKPLLASEADDAFEAIVEDVKKGNYVEVDDLISQKSARW